MTVPQEKDDICNRPQITPTYSKNFVPHQLTNTTVFISSKTKDP